MLKQADPSLIVLPIQPSKQHYSSLSTIKHIKSMEENKQINFSSHIMIINFIQLADTFIFRLTSPLMS